MGKEFVRAWAPKRRTGCITCKIRHVKCDEGKPSCQKCMVSGRSCDGYAASNKAAQSKGGVQMSALQSLSVFQNLDPKEHRAFEYFLACTAPELTGYFSPAIWQQHLPKVGFSDSALRHAIIALASIHEGYADGIQESKRDAQLAAYRFGLRQYSLAVKDLQDAISLRPDNLEPILLCCALFVCFDSLRGNYAAASVHLGAGMKLLSNYRAHNATKGLSASTAIEKRITEMFTALGMQAGLYSNCLLPNSTNTIWEYVESLNPDHDPLHFRSIDDARHSLNMILCNFMLHHTKHQDTHTSDGFEESLPSSTVNADLANWSRAFDAMILQRDPSNLESNALRASIILKLHHASLMILADTGTPSPSPTAAHITDPFQTIITLSRSLLAATASGPRTKANISSDLGLILPLFACISRCTVPELQREALALLKEVPRREGMWDAELIARMAVDVLKAAERDELDNGKIVGKLDKEQQELRITPGIHTSEDIASKSAVEIDFEFKEAATDRKKIILEKLHKELEGVKITQYEDPNVAGHR